MSERQSKPTRTEDVSRVDHLFSLLRETTGRDPSPAIRERLAALAARRLPAHSGSAAPTRSGRPTSIIRLKPAFAVLVLAVAGLATVSVLHFHRLKPVEVHGTAQVNHSVASSGNKATVGAAVQVPMASQRRIYSRRYGFKRLPKERRMILRLPYSNSAIETGTDTTIRVSMSQYELLSLGFPIAATVQDRRIAAELTLGDDGLPRAISLPLPLQVMKEKQ